MPPKENKKEKKYLADQQRIENEIVKDLSLFKPEKILDNDFVKKKIVIQGKIKGSTALIMLNRKGFPADMDQLKATIFNNNTKVELKYNTGDQKHYLITWTNSDDVYATITIPASDKDIAQFEIPEFWFIEETPEVYKKVTYPFISSKKTEWVEKLLNGESPEEFIHNDEEFIMVKNSKWQTDNNAEMNILAFTKIKLMTIRELKRSHLPLLKNIKKKGTRVILDKYKVPACKLRIYFHYLPSIYRLHVHFTTDTAERPETLVDRVHLLSTVINNIEMMSDYYQRATIGLRFCAEYSYNPYRKYLEDDLQRKRNESQSKNHVNYLPKMFLIKKPINDYLIYTLSNYKNVLPSLFFFFFFLFLFLFFVILIQ